MSGHAQPVEDASLAHRAAAGDRDAFAALVVRHQASVFRLARLLTSTADEAEDVLQQTFLAAWTGIRGFRGDASVRTWLLTITRNAALSLRSRSRRDPIQPTASESIADLGLRAGWGGPSPEDLAIARQRHDRLADAFGRLPAADREILTLRDLEGLSGEETALLLGLSVAAMKSRLHRARLALAAALREEKGHAS